MFLDGIDDPGKKERMAGILTFIKDEFPQLEEAFKWNQPMFTDHGAFIIGFRIAKEHIAVAPESIVMKLFENEIKKARYTMLSGNA
ncbi:MAG: iron chaperone [Oscillospiraceae bacterium]